ncbi:MAG: hypothetical protein ACJ76Z_14850 [Thermoleophilaceae bacterium]
MALRRLPSTTLLLVALALLVPAASAHASTSQTSLFEAPRELLSNDDALRARTLDEIDGFGVRWIRLIVFWKRVAPHADSAQMPAFDETDPNAYPGFGPYDRLISEAQARGINVLLTLSGPVPKWATAAKKDYLTKPSVTHWQRFVTAAGRRYGPVIDHWSIWNEPNHPAYLRPQYIGSGSARRPYSPRLYRPLFFAAKRALDATGNAGESVLMGETAPRGGRKTVPPLAFLRGTLCLSSTFHKAPGCALFPADGYAHHAYTTSAGPTFHPSERDDVTIGVLGRLTSALDRAARAHAIEPHMPIYLTEFGIQSYPDPYIGVSLTKQAEYRSISERIAYYNPRVRMFSQYLMRDDYPRPGNTYARYSGFESGLRLSSGRTKPAYEGYRLPLVVHRTSSIRVTLWGLVRPHAGRAQLLVERRTSGSRHWATLASVTTNPNGYWSRAERYRARAWYRVVWTGPSGFVHRGPPTRTY